MKKINVLLVSIGFLLFIIIIIITSLNINEKTLSETITVQPEKIDKIMISTQEKTGQYKSTSNPEQINKIIDYFDQFTYTRLPDDQTSFMPKRATIIYLYEGDKPDFIVSYEKEAMIDHKVYKINHGKIENSFLNSYYHSLN